MKYGIKSLYWFDDNDNKYHEADRGEMSREVFMEFHVLRPGVRVCMNEFIGKKLSLEQCDDYVKGCKLCPAKYNFEAWE